MDTLDPNSSPPRTPPPRSPSIPQTPSSAGRINQTPSRFNFPESSPSSRKRRRSTIQHNVTALARMIAPGANPPESLSRQSHLTPNTPSRGPRTPRRSLNNRKLSGFLPGTPRRSSFRNTAFSGQTYRARSLLKVIETPARVNRLADIRTPSDLLRLLTRMPDFQKDPSPTPRQDQMDHNLADVVGQDDDTHFPETPQGGRESILPDMSIDEMHARFQLLDEDEKTFVRDSLEFGFRHHRNRRGFLSSDEVEKQRRLTYNSDATFGDSMWEDEDELMEEEVSMDDDVATSKAHRGEHQQKVSRESSDEIDLTMPVHNELAAKEEQPEALTKVPTQSTPSPTLEHEDDMPVDFDPQIGEGDDYEVDEEIDDHAKQAHMESKQARLSQLGFAPIDELENRVSGMHGSSRPKLQPQSPIPEPDRPLVQVTLAQLAARSGAEVDQLRRENKAPAQKVSEAGVVVPNLPKALIKDLFSSFSRTKVSREALETVMEASHQFFAQASEDLSVYAGHAGRTMIQETDVECLMRRQRLLNDKVSMESLAHKLLPRELWDEICVSALANNELHPRRQAPP
ncbi:hypothetical protein K450DRAFT_259234 [Umbelopsis ramanniana AG]|uniref:CENP-T/Histone H4 histone fold domain-containing protein n=1 Tax=Umbelopsis ramanniana AG TaxID=1314678 RepID=A0AAD5HAY2_UMBRA|nr:uncharacterized protein K450DRAFT_259234 [Umbelopsis ramanniana AG]KAI8575971.1 hypothetical protein K450DRAFT_259234 [Umbelopsis ramanniana AG]